MRAFLVAAAALAALPALAQDRPSEEAIFGAPAEAPKGKETPAQPSDRPSEDAMFGEGGTPAEKPSAQPAAVKPSQPSNRPSEDAMFGEGGAPAERPSAQPAAVKPPPSTTELAEEEREKAPEDPLRIGGQFYWRAYSVASERIPPSGWTFSAPTLLDAYFDARPNERIRGFALGRVTYDPTVNETSSTPPTPMALMAASQKQLNVVLDQLWLRFDLGRSAFITAGRQHVKWGVGRFWNPTDYLHQVYRDPLTQFDARVGTTMVKLNVPWERKGWNFYGIGLLEDTVPGGSLGKIGAGARAEVVLGSAEFGIDALVQRSHRPRFGADFSAGLGPVDVYGEVALRKGAGTLQDHLVEIDGNPVGCEETTLEGDTVQATGGATYAFNFTDEFVLTAGAEYFFNSAGATRAKDYPCMMSKGQFTPFYAGKHYLGLFASWINPSRRTAPVVALTNLSNLSDLSHLARLDYSMMLLTHLRVEAYTAYHYGHRGGEFRFGIDYPSKTLADGSSTPAIFWPYQAVELGVGLRISL